MTTVATSDRDSSITAWARSAGRPADGIANQHHLVAEVDGGEDHPVDAEVDRHAGRNDRLDSQVPQDLVERGGRERCHPGEARHDQVTGLLEPVDELDTRRPDLGGGVTRCPALPLADRKDPAVLGETGTVGAGGVGAVHDAHPGLARGCADRSHDVQHADPLHLVGQLGQHRPGADDTALQLHREQRRRRRIDEATEPPSDTRLGGLLGCDLRVAHVSSLVPSSWASPTSRRISALNCSISGSDGRWWVASQVAC